MQDITVRKPQKQTTQRKLLSLDGGGMLGLITLEILKKLESDLANATNVGRQFRLGHFFDFIAGNSTGSIIATGLSLGMSVDELIEFYVSSGEQMFSKNSWLKRLRAKYSETNLTEILKDVTKNELLGSDKLLCMLMIVLQNASTNSTWLISNNPHSKYNDLKHPFCNLRLPLWQLVRASTAAPTFFRPEEIAVNAQGENNRFYFVDGGVSPHNNPALALYRTISHYHDTLKWDEGESNMLLISVGTGEVPRGDETVSKRGRMIFRNAKRIPTEMIATLSAEQDLNCRFLGRCVFGAPVDRELGDMIPRNGEGEPIGLDTDTGKKFSYARFNPDLSVEGLERLGLKNIDPDKFLDMDETSHVKEFRKVGRVYSEKYVNIETFSGFLE